VATITTRRIALNNQQGFALVYLAIGMTVLLLFSGLAIDAGRAYVVKAQLTKAVDGAALAAARNLNSGNPQAEATRIFQANFPPGYLGVSSITDPTNDPNFFKLTTEAGTGVNVVTVTATANLPTTFMTLGNFDHMTVVGNSQAQRRMVDLSLVIDVSSSIGSQWPTVRDAARSFIKAFDPANDRMALITFSNGSIVLDQMPANRGFNQAQVVNDVPQNLPGGSTLMVEGIYRGWDELRSVPTGTQSGLRVIVLFTDGASNGVPGNYEASPGVSKALRTYDFPKSANDPDNQTWNNPVISGLYDAQTGAQAPAFSLTTAAWNSNQTVAQVPLLPLTTWHTHSRSVGIPTTFPLETNTLMVNGAPQNTKRPLRNQDGATGRFPADVWNTNNTARNVLEIIANAARNDAGGDYPIRIYTIGMSYLVRDLLGTMPEMPEDILKRISNDKTSPDFNNAQLEGKYYYAPTAADVGPAFEGIQNEIVRLSK
jgi:Flp pilus assembly protein TadG